MEVTKIERWMAMRKARAFPARRCLFGTPTPDDRLLTKTLVAEQSAHLDAACRTRWNFDFKRFKPLEGRYAWEKVSEAPRTYQHRPASPRTPIVSSLQLDDEDTCCLDKREDETPDRVPHDSGVFSDCGVSDEELPSAASTNCSSSSALPSSSSASSSSALVTLRKRTVPGKYCRLLYYESYLRLATTTDARSK